MKSVNTFIVHLQVLPHFLLILSLSVHPYPPFCLPPNLLSVFPRPIQGHRAHRTYKDYTRECERAIYFVWSPTDLWARGQSPFLYVQRQISSSPAHGIDNHKDKKQIRSVHPSRFLYSIITNRSHSAIHFKATKPCVFSTSTICLFLTDASKLRGYTEVDLSCTSCFLSRRRMQVLWTVKLLYKTLFPSRPLDELDKLGSGEPQWTTSRCWRVHQKIYNMYFLGLSESKD